MQDIFLAIQALAMNFVHAYKKGEVIKKKGRWSKPPPGHQILNVDASFMEAGSQGPVGAVVRDDTAGFVGACCKSLINVFDAELAEAVAL